MSVNLQNWSGHHAFSATSFHQPESVEELQEVVSRSHKVKVFGARHSFNNIADSTGAIISLEKLDQTLAIDKANNTVTVSGGILYGELCRQLQAEGHAIHNMASLPHITVAGAISTATHGSGDTNGNLATAVAGIEFVTASGDLVTLSRTQNKEDFEGAVVGLGGVGVIHKVTLDIAPAFSMQQEVYEFLPTEQMEANYDAITSAAYSVSFFTDWKPGRVSQVWLKRRLDGSNGLALEPTFYGATLASKRISPVGGAPAEHCTDQEGIVGPWNERLPHFRIEHHAERGDELQSEYFVPRQHAIAAMRILTELQPQYESFMRISEVRTVAADKLWLSPSYEQAIVGLHFTWHKDWAALSKFLPVLEEAFAPYRARPHWGKLFIMSPSWLQSLYPRMGDFRDLLQRYDPTGKFRNPFLDHYIFGA